MCRKIYLCIFAMIFIITLTKCDLFEVYTNTDEISGVIKTLQPRIIDINNISIKTQPDAYTCGITAVTVISNYYNSTNYEVDDLAKKYNASNGVTVNDMKKWLQGELPGKNIVYETNGTNEDMIRNIHTSLHNNSPVVIFFGSPNPYNKPYYDFHGSVVYGINLDNETITIANSYGYREETPLADFLNRMLYTEIDKYPPVQQFQLKRNRMDRNAYFLIKS